jgi:glucosamine--fructose-6-phosphate aminotransferase (isomerizing)
VTSQSGESAEIVALLDALPSPAAVVLAVVNNLTSPLAQRADIVIPLHVGSADDGVAGTGTFANSIVVNSFATDEILGVPHDHDVLRAADVVGSYLEDWDAHVEHGLSFAPQSGRLAILGRGPSLAAVRTGALLIKEAGKVHAEGMAASEFRHGPVELVDEHFLAVIAAGERRTLDLNVRIAGDIVAWGGRVAWIGDDGPSASTLTTPALAGEARPIAELLPLQMMSVAAARGQGIEPGVFKNARRVTRTL